MNSTNENSLLGKLVDKLQQCEASVGIVGLGYVGLPLYIRFVESGYRTIGFDIDSTKIDALKSGRSYLTHVSIEKLKIPFSKNTSDVTTDFSGVKELDALIICVPTPLDQNRDPDLSYVIGSLESVLPYLKPGQVVSLESTTYPGTTEEELLPRIENQGLTVGRDIFLVYSPEREDPGNTVYNTHNVPKIVGGYTSNCLEAGLALYQNVISELVPVSSTNVAEMAKILENTYRAVNIALVNELKIVADKMNIDIFEVIRAAATKPFGFTPFYPGPGLGGHCIPIDPFYLSWKARQFNISTKFIELAGEVNTAMPEYVVNKTVEVLNSHNKEIKDSRILVLGLAYKKNVSDTRESPGAEIINLLISHGAVTDYSDPWVPVFPKMRNYDLELHSQEITATSLSCYDCVIVVTNHDGFDWDLIYENSHAIIDTRGIFDARLDKIFRA